MLNLTIDKRRYHYLTERSLSNDWINRMCRWGDDVKLLVPIPAELSHTGMFRWDVKGIDRCIAPIVQALNDAGIYTANCCCGHGRGDGIISLHDGRDLIIKQAHGSIWGGKRYEF